MKGVEVFDDVDILDAEAVAGTEDGGGVVGLVDVFEGEGEPAGAAGEDGFEAFAAMGGEAGGEAIHQGGGEGGNGGWGHGKRGEK